MTTYILFQTPMLPNFCVLKSVNKLYFCPKTGKSGQNTIKIVLFSNSGKVRNAKYKGI